MQTLILLKPDCLQRNLVGECLRRFERRGLKIIAMKRLHPVEHWWERHYEEHKGKSFYAGLIAAMRDKPIIAVMLDGDDAVRVARQLVGPCSDAQPGTIRGDYCVSDSVANLVHSSSHAAAAAREAAIWFGSF